jgi:Polysaccharide lyase
MRRLLLIAAALVLLGAGLGLALTTGDDGEILWRGDFETGDLSQWEDAQQVDEDKITVVDDPVREGDNAARFEVEPDDNIGDTAPRAELTASLHEQEGEDRYYRWFSYFPDDFPTDYDEEFVTFTQWRATDESEAYTAFMVWGDEVELHRDGERWSAPLEKDTWHEFIYHVKWSPDPDVGFIELWYDGELVLPEFAASSKVTTKVLPPGGAVSACVNVAPSYPLRRKASICSAKRPAVTAVSSGQLSLIPW